MPRDETAREILQRLGDPEKRPGETITPYEEFSEGGATYYFTPGGFLYRKDPGSEEVGGFFCGYLSGEAWHRRSRTGSAVG